MRRFSSRRAAPPDDAPDAVAFLVLVAFVGAIAFLAGTLGQVAALWHMGAL